MDYFRWNSLCNVNIFRATVEQQYKKNKENQLFHFLKCLLIEDKHTLFRIQPETSDYDYHTYVKIVNVENDCSIHLNLLEFVVKGVLVLANHKKID